ncbi:MAG: primosomal protein N' [Candidatus Margulisiibacteriota bacterium]
MSNFTFKLAFILIMNAVWIKRLNILLSLNIMTYVRVADLIILANVPQRYSYIVPENMAIEIGQFVDVTFARRKQVGMCVDIKNISPEKLSFKLSVIDSIHDKRAHVPLSIIRLIAWFSTFYCVSEYKAFQCVVGLKRLREAPVNSNANIEQLNSLSPEQMNVYNNINASKNLYHLLHGVTGSGKTSIYAHLIRDCIAIEKSVIMLIPEISLTPQLTAVFSNLFKGVAVVHSGLTPKRKEEIWNQCLRGELNLVIGPRSAIFMPFQNLGLIIVDEEHDSSYKQESSPRYYTHDIVFKRSEIHHAKVVFGSATPSVDTYFLSQNNQLNYHPLKNRYNDYEMPNVMVLDMKTSYKNQLIHDELLEKIEQNIVSKQRTLILVNRRGYSSFLKCGACGAIQKCQLCDTSFTYHSDGYFRCHRCSSIKRMSRQCIDCRSYDVEYQGIAIQKVEMELRRLFPDIVISRIDRDNVKTFDDLQTALAGVNESDILIGTQMIAKGHNFKNVSLVGMIGVDTLLNFPDFRSTERLFQLITQMAGRAGRDLNSSSVYVQTYQPNHYVFHFSKTHDVDGFLNQEIEFRRPFNYPPFFCLVNVIFSSKKHELFQRLYSSIQTFNESLRQRFSDMQIVGPKVAPIEKVNGYLRHNVFYKISLQNLDEFKTYLNRFPKYKDVRLVIDVSPNSLL